MDDIAKFLSGFERFRTRYFEDEPALFAQLSQGQNPGTLVIACCDSRVDPALLMGCGPGELFVVRNVANLVPPYQLHADEAPGIRSAVEFAVKGLKVRHIIVLGHSSCGGIKALMDGEGVTRHDFEFIGQWVAIAQQARNRVMEQMQGAAPEEMAHCCEREAILVSLDNLRSFPWISQPVADGKLSLHGWYFDLEHGLLLAHSARSGRFEPAQAIEG
jgi:carbonic anhydrase